MAFLTLNGWTVAVSSGGEIEPREIGSTRRSQNGALFKQRVAIKRRWRFVSAPLSLSDAQALIGLVLGDGLRFRYNPTGAWSVSPSEHPQSSNDDVMCASSTGLTPSVENNSTMESNRAADGKRAITLVSAPSTYREHDWIGGDPQGAIHCEEITTNILPASQRDCEDTPSTDFNNFNAATLSDNTTDYWQGAKSLKITTTAGANRGAITNTIAASPGQTYTGSIYLLGASGGETVRLFVEGVGGSVDVLDVVLTTAGVWCRAWLTHTTTAGTTSVRMGVYDTNAGDAQVWSCDGWQLEQKDHYTQWVDGARGTQGGLRYPPAPLHVFGSHTVAGWTTGPRRPTGAPSNAWVHDFALSNGTSRSWLIYSTVNNKLQCAVVGPSVQYLTCSSPNLLDAGWHHIAHVYDSDIPSLTLYEDGSQVAQDITPVGLPPDYSVVTNFSIANQYTGAQDASGISIGDLQVVPYAMPSAQVAGLAARTSILPAPPKIEAAGDFFDRAVTVMGRVSRSSYLGVSRSAAWQNNNLRVSFELEEA